MEALQTHGLAPEDDVRRGFAWMQGQTARGEFPGTIHDLVAWTTLGVREILKYEELARETVTQLRQYGAPQPERVVWSVKERRGPDAPAWWPQSGRQKGLATLFANGDLGVDFGWLGKMLTDCEPPKDLWRAGLSLDAITADAVILVVPPGPGIAR